MGILCYAGTVKDGSNELWITAQLTENFDAMKNSVFIGLTEMYSPYNVIRNKPCNLRSSVLPEKMVTSFSDTQTLFECLARVSSLFGQTANQGKT